MNVKETADKIAELWTVEKFKNQKEDSDIKFYSRLPVQTYETEQE